MIDVKRCFSQLSLMTPHPFDRVVGALSYEGVPLFDFDLVTFQMVLEVGHFSKKRKTVHTVE